MHIAFVQSMTGKLLALTLRYRIRHVSLVAVGSFCLALCSLMFTTSLVAQATENPPADNLDDGNLSTAPAGEHEDEVQRRIQRLGDVVGEAEWEPELSVPGREGVLPFSTRLPESEKQEKLQTLLSRVVENPSDPSATQALNRMLTEIIVEANADIDENRLERAEQQLAVVAAIDRNYRGIAEARQRIAELGETEGQLAAARKAMQEGRIDQPEDNSAWYYYRLVVEKYPENEEAIAGLIQVQKHLTEGALALAREFDFDSAERLLEDASYVNQDPRSLDQAREEIDQLRQNRADQLESRAVKSMDSGDFVAAEKAMIELVALGGQESTVNQLRRRLEEARMYGGFKPGQILRDHFLTAGTWAPETVVILAGSFMMGSTAFEEGRVENESPQHRVTFRSGFALGQREVSVAEFREFVKKAGYRTDAERVGHSTVYDNYSGRLTQKDDIDWELNYEGEPADPKDPVVHVSWNDAQAYVNWLARGTGKSYRLPSEAEFEYALRGGKTTRYWWGDGSPASLVENLTGDGDVSRGRRRWSVAFKNYSDKYWGPAPVASFAQNPFGLYDIGGNVGEWTRDCWHDTYIRAPADGSAWVNPGCGQRVIRGGYWASSPDQTRASYRLFAKPDHHDARIGFRIARDL